MRRPRYIVRRVGLAILVGASLVAVSPLGARTPAPPLRMADAYGQQIAQLQAQYDSLGSQVGSLQGQQATVAAQVLALQQNIASTQTQLQTVQAQITELNLELAQTGEAIQVDQTRVASDKAQLSEIIVDIYTVGGESTVDALVDSQSFGQLMDQVANAQSVSNKFQALIVQIHQDQARLDALLQTQQTQLADATQQSAQLTSLESQLQSQQAQLQPELASLTGQVATLTSDRTSILNQIAGVRAQQQAAAAAVIVTDGTVGKVKDDRVETDLRRLRAAWSRACDTARQKFFAEIEMAINAAEPRRD